MSINEMSFDTAAPPALLTNRSVGRYEQSVKRVVDLLGSLALLVVLAPIMVAIAIAIRVWLGSGVLYTQQRVGMDGSTFTIFKFRTMLRDRRERSADGVSADRRTQHKADNDPRHTRIGRLLRKTSLDELPQLFNVLRGEMSLVGPRPELVEVAHERGYFDHPRHLVRPGMTGPYQTSPLRLSGDLRQGLELDAEYVSDVSLRGDLKQLVRTISVFVGGASQGS